MPTVPLYKQNDLMPRSLGLTKDVPDRVGVTWQTVGNELGVSARTMQQRAVQNQERQDTADTINAYSRYRDLERQWQFEMESRRLSDARGMTNDFKAWSEKTKGEILKDLTPGAKARFSAVVTEHLNSEIDSVAKREAKELHSYIDSTAKSVMLEAQGNIAATPGDSRKILSDYELQMRLLYGEVPRDKKMEDRRQIIQQAAEDLASQGRYKESLELIKSNTKILGSKFSDVKDKVVDLVMAEQDRIDKQAEKIVKKSQEAAEDGLYLSIVQEIENPGSVESPVDLTQLNEALATRRITREAHKRLRTMLETEDDYEDDPHVLAEIYEEADPERRRRLLSEGLSERGITPKTYTTEVKNLVNNNYRDASKNLSSMLKPPPFYMGQDKWVRYAEGMDYFNKLVQQGVSPEDAKNQVANSYVGDLRRSERGLPLPKYWRGGDKMDNNNIDVAEGMTRSAYESGELRTWEYEMQMDLISKMREMAMEVPILTDEQKARLKSAGIN